MQSNTPFRPAGKCTLVKTAHYDGQPADRIEIHPGKGFRAVSVADGSWHQFERLSKQSLYLRAGVRLTFQRLTLPA